VGLGCFREREALTDDDAHGAASTSSKKAAALAKSSLRVAV
jgi:hypothetical protein